MVPMAKVRNKQLPVIPHDHDTLLVVGGAPCVWDDLEAWWEFDHHHDVCVVNEIGRLFPCHFQHAFSYHHTFLVEKGITAPFVHTIRRGGDYSGMYPWRLRDTGGSSGFMAARCAIKYWGYKRVVVAGCPINNDGHFSSLAGSPDSYRYAETFLSAWRRHHKTIGSRLRSMSGNTRDIYGPPTKEWLNDVNDC